MMMWMLLSLVGCESAPQELVSKPVPPTLDLQDDLKEELPIKWTTLPHLFPKGDVALPPLLSAFSLGMPAAEARAAMDGVCDAQMSRPEEQEVGEVTAVGCRLEDWERIGMTLLLKDGALDQMDLTLPLDGAFYALPEAWGEPVDQQVKDEVSTPSPVWRSGELQAVLTKVDADDGILKYTTVEK